MPKVELYRLQHQFVSINILGKDTSLLNSRRISYKYSYNHKKRDDVSISFLDEDRALTDGDLLYINSNWSIRWGWEGYLLSPIVNVRLKSWNTVYNAEIPVLNCEFVVTKGDPVLTDEAGLKRQGKMWGKKNSSDIAKAIALKLKLKYDIDESEDKEDVDYFQPIMMSDYAYLEFLSSEIGFDFKINNDRLYYKKRDETNAVSHIFVFMPDSGDSVALEFKPDVKVVAKTTKPVGAEVQKSADKVVDGYPPVASKEQIAAVDLLTETLASNDKLLGLADTFLASEQTKVITAQKVFDTYMRTTGPSPLTTAAAKVLFDRQAGLAYAHKNKAIFVDAATEYLLDTQKAIYDLNHKTENGDAKNCKPSGAEEPGTEAPKQDIKYSVEIGLGDARTEKLVVEGVESTLAMAGSGAKKAAVACAKNKEKTEKAVKASLSCIGLPFLKERQNILLVNYGPKFSGIWHISECTHTLDTGFVVEMELKRGAIKTKKSKDKKKANEAASDMVVKEPSYVVEIGLNDQRYDKIRRE